MLRGTPTAVALPAAELVELAPSSFETARQQLGVQSEWYHGRWALSSIGASDGPGGPLWPSIKTMAGAGKSGARFWVSADSKLLVKSATSSEARTLLSLLPAYLAHLATTPRTLLPRYCALVRLCGHHFIVMENFFASGRLRHDLANHGSPTVLRKLCATCTWAHIRHQTPT